MKKIGLVTLQYAYNFGAILQLYALQKKIKDLGFEAEVINYIPDNAKPTRLWNGWGLRGKNVVENIKNRLIMLRHGGDSRERFNLFRNDYLKISDPISFNNQNKSSKFLSNYNALITGSDQVWKYDRQAPYFLEFGVTYEGKRISYAPSCGTKEQNAERSKKIGEWINKFSAISVRDNFSKKIVDAVSGRKSKIVADPTLLVDFDEFISSQNKIINEKYAFVYILGDEINGGHEKIFNTIKSELSDIKIVAVIASAHKPKKINGVDKLIYDAGPKEWVSLLANSSFVYTDSFHCSIFSLKYGKPFLAYYSEEDRAPRLVDLKTQYRLENNIVSSVEEAQRKKFWKTPNYNLINTKVSEHVKYSNEYLINSLKEI